MEKDKSKNLSIRSQVSVKSKQESIKRRVEKFNDEKKKYAGEKDDEYMERRKRRNEKKKRLQRDRKLRRFKCLYWPSAIMLTCGCVFTFGATVRSLGEGSIIWENRLVLRIVGPILIGLGLVFLLATNAIINKHVIRITKINEEDLQRRKDLLRRQILQRYLKKQNGFYNDSKPRVGRTISGTSTCYSIEDIDDSQILFTNSIASSASLHPFWRPQDKRDILENDDYRYYSKYLDSSQTSNSTLMTSIRSNGTAGTNGLSVPLDLKQFNFIDEDVIEDSCSQNKSPIKGVKANGRIHSPRELRKVEFIDETRKLLTTYEQTSC